LQVDWADGSQTILTNVAADQTISISPPPPLPNCPADVTANGEVDVDDLLVVINAWGDCAAPPSDCPADIDISGVIDVDDLLSVLNNWS
jgi:hypothetical protein